MNLEANVSELVAKIRNALHLIVELVISSSLRHSTAHCLSGVSSVVFVTATVIDLVNAPFTFISKLLGRKCSRFLQVHRENKLK